MPNDAQFNLEHRLRTAEKLGFRCVLVLQKRDVSTLINYLHDIVKILTPYEIPNNQNNSDVSDQINSLLGTDQNCITFDSSTEFNPNLLAAAAGTVIRGGVFALIPPPSNSRFTTRFNRILDNHRDALLLQDEIALNNKAADASQSNTDWQTEQNQLVDRLLAQFAQKQSTSVVQADRGRGKSTLIGRALAKSNMEATLTAPQRSACKVLLQHADSAPVHYLPVDQALNSNHSLLIVEEAGSIPIPVLRELMDKSEHIVFATTVQGYEGAGRGFALRFKRVLDTVKPDWQQLSPTYAIRWSAGDPLEHFVNEALLLSNELPDIDTELVNASQTTVRLLEKDELATNEALLAAVYGLLIQAHYQTTPNDLRNILDAPQLQVYAQFSGTTMTGAALVATEGNIPGELHTPIIENSRRLPDQLVPQLLAQSANDASVLAQPFARIVRVAIHPHIQRQGFGTAFLNQLKSRPSLKPYTLAASFGADTATLGFWLQLGYTPVHYGYKRNPRSGLRSVCVIHSHSPVKAVIESATTILRQNLLTSQRLSLAHDQICQQLLEHLAHHSTPLSEHQRMELQRKFLQGQRQFMDTIGFIDDALLATMNSYHQASAQDRKKLENNLRKLVESNLNR